MCGVVGYVDSRQATPILLEGLEKLEYRGYNSVGIAARDDDKEPIVVKAKGQLRVLADKTDNGHALKGCCDIKHARWAIHGVPSEANTHPHVSTDGSVLAVRNGIFENYLEVREKLAHHNYRFCSQADTEAIVNLINYYYKKYKMGPIDAIAKTLVRVRGDYALAIISRDYPEQTYIARKDNPLIVRLGEGENFITSNPSACLKYTRRVCYIDNFEMGCATKGSITSYDLNGDVVEKTPVLIDWDETAAERGGYGHFMMKEIHEQSRAIVDTFRTYLSDETDGKKLDYRVDLAKLGLADELIQNLGGTTVAGCGSVYHVGATAQHVIEDPTKLSVRIGFTSEYHYHHPVIDPDNLVVIISQSGETADTLAAMREAKEQGLEALMIVDAIGSVIARETDFVLYTYAGPEISVAATKAYSTQLIGVYLFTICLGKARGPIDEREERRLLAEIAALPKEVQRIIGDKERLQWFATKLSNAKDIFFIGRGTDYAICMEDSLKMKEVSYVHSEIYVMGELKHSTINLVEDGTLVIDVLAQSGFYKETFSNLVEVKNRGAYLIGLMTSGNYDIEDMMNFTFFLPKIDGHFTDSLAVVPLRLLGYCLAVSEKLNVDRPRNLAESMTVE